ncbi:hypothetical protein KPL70_006871 [Citrus sinensis]|nr:hypothetical protein KPL70_006871 [Citrus sinensis]
MGVLRSGCILTIIFLDFPERLNIMIDMALAFEYLHHGRSTPMVHCDLKPSNNLLDEDMVAHVSDFNISKLLGEGEDSMTQTMTIATFGYMALGNAPRLIPNFVLFSRVETFTRKKPTIEMIIG